MCRYENNTTFFQLVDVPNATKFVVTFDSQSRTETGYVQSSPPATNSGLYTRLPLLCFAGVCMCMCVCVCSVMGACFFSCDYVTFFKDTTNTASFGAPTYSGTSFPGMNGMPPLEIKASSFNLYVMLWRHPVVQPLHMW
jgi:hypothetical protein